jgi:hypothetical protein
MSVPSRLNTIRAAQQILVAEGTLRTRQGAGAIVTSTRSLRQADPVDLLKTANDALNAALEVLEAKSKHAIVFDLDDDTYYVLTAALGEWAADQRHHAENELRDDPEDPTAASRLARAGFADRLLERIEAAPGTRVPRPLGTTMEPPPSERTAPKRHMNRRWPSPPRIRRVEEPTRQRRNAAHAAHS